MILAGIDIGTNSLRLLIAETGPDSIREIYSDRMITRLGQDLDRTGLLSRDAEDRSLHALVSFSESIKRYGAVHTAAIGTSALRNALNADDFIPRVVARTGIPIRVVSGQEEARLTLLGVMQALRKPSINLKDEIESAIIVDIGGGSTEIMMVQPEKETLMESLPLGAVYLTDRFIRHDPPAIDEALGLKKAVKAIIELHCDRVKCNAANAFIGTAGTATTLAAMDQRLAEYDPRRINGYIMTRDAVNGIADQLVATTLVQRRSLPGLERGREDIIYAGTVVTQELMEWFAARTMIVSDGGLREGILLDLYQTMQGAGT